MKKDFDKWNDKKKVLNEKNIVTFLSVIPAKAGIQY